MPRKKITKVTETVEDANTASDTATPSSRPAHSLPLLATRLFNTPLLIEPGKAEVLARVVGGRMGVGGMSGIDSTLTLSAPLADSYYSPNDSTPYESVDGIAIIPVSGALINRDSGMSAFSGLCSYEQLRSDCIRAATDSSISGILLRINSPGGEVHGLFDLADEIMACSTRKRVWASVDDMAFSAGYLIASSASRIFTTRTSGVGSIGVVAMRLDATEADKEMGLKYHIIKAGERKVDGNPHTPFPKEAQAALQAEVDRIMGMFVEHVAKRRGMGEESVRGLEAGLVWGEQAVAIGLSDASAPFQEVFQRMKAEIASNGSTPSPSNPRGRTVAYLTSSTDLHQSPLPVPSPPQPVQKSTTLPLSQPTPDVLEANKESEEVEDEITQPTQTATQADATTTATTAVEPAPAAQEPTVAPEAATAPSAPEATAPAAPIAASTDFIVDMCAIAGREDLIKDLRGKGLTEAQVRAKLISLRSESQSATPIRSTIIPGSASSAASEPITSLMSRAAQLAAENPKLTKEQHFRQLLRSNPQAYQAYLEANPAQQHS